MAEEESAVAATQAYAVILPEASVTAPTQAYPDKPGQEGEATQAEEPPKKKRGKPKDEHAPPKPKNGYQKITGEARARLKEQRPELATDLKAMGLALKEEWDKVTEAEKERLQKEYEEEMAIWKPKWEAYKKTPHYKEFFEIKQDWVDARARKKLVKKLNADAPKRPKSGYMIYAGEIRERVQKEVFDSGGGMGDIGKKISEEWAALGEEKQAEYKAKSEEMKKDFDVKFADYKKSEAWAKFCDEKAKLESKQLQKKLIRTKLDEAPKKAPSAYALFRSEVMPKVVEENKGLSCGELGKKIAAMWVEVSEDKKAEYQAQAGKLKEQYEQNLIEFKKNKKYTQYLLERQQVKAKENKLLNLRETPKRPKNAFAMYAEVHKNEVEPGKGEGKGRSALMQKYLTASEEEKAQLLEKEKELKIKWMEDMEAFKTSQKFLGFKNSEKKINMEFMNEAMKVVTLRFLSDAPQQPPKSPFAVFVADKRKAAAEAEGAPAAKSRKERMEEMVKYKQEWAKADLQTKYTCDVQRKERLAKWKEDCKEFMTKETWQEYLAECKRLKVPVQSLLKEKKKILRKLKNGMAILPLPQKPEGLPSKPPNAMRLFIRDKLGEITDKTQIPEMWQKLDAEGKKKYTEEAEEKMKAYRQEYKDFAASEEGKTYFKEVKLVARRNRVAKAKDFYLADMPKKPVGALKNFAKKHAKALRIQNPEAKGDAFKKLLMDKWNALDLAEKEPLMQDEKTKQEEYEKSMTEFKRSESWLKFKKAVQMKVKKPKAKAKGPANIPKPKKPEGLPQKPLDAVKCYLKDMASTGKSAADLVKQFNELPDEEKAEKKRIAQEKLDEYNKQAADFDKTPEGKKYNHAVASWIKKKRLAIAKLKFLKNEPKRPQAAFQLFVSAKRSDVMRDHPDLKGLGPVQQKLGEMWKELSDEQREEWNEKEKAAKEEHEKAVDEFQKSADYKKYSAIVARLVKKPGAKAKAKSKGIALPPPPANLPKKPPTGFFLYLSEQRSSGTSATPAKMTDAWRELKAEGQKKYMDEAAAKQRQYEKDMKEFTKSADGKKYLRLRAAAEKKNRIETAKRKFLGAEDAPKEPKRPPSAYFLFVQETRSKLPPGKIGEVARQLTSMWQNLNPEEKKVYEDKTEELKKQYEKDMAEYKNSANFKKYDKALKNITKRKSPKGKAKAAAKAPAGRGAAAAGGRGRGAGRGGGRAPAAAEKPAASDSDSDVMGSDEDNSSSSDSDSD